MPEQRRNGSGTLTYRWLVGVLLSLTVMGGAGWMTSLHAQVITITQTMNQHGERLAVVETATRSIDRSLLDIKDVLHRLEDRVETVGDRKR